MICKIKTITFLKGTASNTIMLAGSCHRIHTIKAIPVGELIRAKRNCSTTSEFALEANNIYGRLQQRVYPPWMLDRALEKVIRISLEISY